jgi:hypothetical protein
MSCNPSRVASAVKKSTEAPTVPGFYMPVMLNQEALRPPSKATSVGGLFGVVPKRRRDLRDFSPTSDRLRHGRTCSSTTIRAKASTQAMPDGGLRGGSCRQSADDRAAAVKSLLDRRWPRKLPPVFKIAQTRIALLVDDERFLPAQREDTLDRFIHQKNLEHFRRLLAEPDAEKDRERQTMLLSLLAEEEIKDKQPLDVRRRIADA